MKPIELQIYWMNEAQTKLKDVGVVEFVPIDELETRPVTFYHIHSIEPYEHKDGKWCSAIDSGSESYICNLKYNELKKIVDAAHTTL